MNFDWEMYGKYPLVVLAGLLATLTLTPQWRNFALRRQFVDQPGGRKIHREPIALGGGVALFVGFHLVCALVFLYPWKPFAGQISIDWWYRFALLSSCVVALGLWDDRFGTRPAFKLGVQTAISVCAYLLDIRMQNILGVELPGWIDLLATVLWFLVLMNSFNLIDGVDGLATGIAMIASAGIGLSMIFRSGPGDTLLFIGLAGVCLGFLRYNFYPASIFLGDTGSLFLGFTIAALALSTNSKGTAIAGIGMPLLAVGVPLFDTLLAVWRRSVRRMMTRSDHGQAGGLGIDRADAEHLHHRLLGTTGKHSRVALLLYTFTLFLTAGGLLASIFNDRALGILSLTFLIAAYTVVRHLAWIELRDSGQFLLRGLTRPIRRNRTLLFYIAIDMLVLNAAMLIAMVMLDWRDGVLDDPWKAMWLSSAPMNLFVPFLFLLSFRAYTRVWHLARISEYVSVGVAVLLGSATAFSLSMLGLNGDVSTWYKLVYYLVFAGFAAPAVVAARAGLRLVQDVMQWRGKMPSRPDGHVDRALVCGSDYLTTIFLRQHATHIREQVTPVDVIGLISADDAIRGHFVHGVKVLGNLEEVPALIDMHKIDLLVLVEPSRGEQVDRLLAEVASLPVKVVRWEAVETVLK